MSEMILKLLKENPEMVMPVIKEMINKYKPLVYELGNELLNVYKDYANNDEYFKTAAQVNYKMYKELVDAGFTDEQAFTLILDRNTRMEKHMASISVNTKR